MTELRDTGNMQAICVTCVEFVNIMAEMDRLAEAAPMLDHLDATFPYWVPLVAEARTRITFGGHQVTGGSASRRPRVHAPDPQAARRRAIKPAQQRLRR